ncbi:zinc finger protein 853-like [Euwallacea fornicatus]|uniref:zinc finger protein 853-like n=1 Tax=Euwallacea fornicatus TaxID=995702 RepID=UPI00338EBF21
MKSIALLAFLALASANPLGLNTVGVLNGLKKVPQFGTLGQGNAIWQSPAQQASQQIAQEIQQAQIAVQQRGFQYGVGQEDIESVAAQQVAQGVVEQALLARQGQTIEGIQQLQQQLLGKSSWVPTTMGYGIQEPTLGAIQSLKNQLRYQQRVAPQIVASSQLARTLETVIDAQLTSESVGIQQGLKGDIQTQVQQLIDITNIKEIQVEITRQQVIIDQLRVQQQLVNQQLVQMQSQRGVVLQVPQLQNALEGLEQQEQQLMNQILARQLVIQQLQQALWEQQQQLQQDIVQQQVQLGNVRVSNQWTVGNWPNYGIQYGIGKPRVGPLVQYGNVGSQTKGPFAQLPWSWNQGDVSV